MPDAFAQRHSGSYISIQHQGCNPCLPRYTADQSSCCCQVGCEEVAIYTPVPAAEMKGCVQECAQLHKSGHTANAERTPVYAAEVVVDICCPHHADHERCLPPVQPCCAAGYALHAVPLQCRHQCSASGCGFQLPACCTAQHDSMCCHATCWVWTT